MSRVDDDREAARLAERLVREKQQTDAKQKGTAESAFARMVKATHQHQEGEHQSSTRLSSSILEEAMEQMLGGEKKDGNASSMRQSGKSFGEKLQQDRSTTGARQGENQTAGLSQDKRARLSRSEGARENNALMELKEKDRKASAALGGSPRADDDVSTDQDGGGQKGEGGDKKEGGGDMGQGFRFNPALMAPVPVAQRRDTSAADRLRALATEIAQKIVERARVGTNASGQAEFQMDLRSNVLSGLSIKVSGGNGKIKAVFSGNDREVMKLLRQNSDGLKKALEGRGLTLEEFKIEERA